MSVTITDSTKEPRSFSNGPVKFQVMDYSVGTGVTSGTITADKLKTIDHILMLGGRLNHTAAPTYSDNVATLAFSVPAETAASKSFQTGFTVTAVANEGAAGNNITVAATGGGTAGSEVVTVTGTAISVQIQNAVSTAEQVLTAINASVAAAALVNATVITTAQTITTFAATNLAGGVTGGARGSCLAIGV